MIDHLHLSVKGRGRLAGGEVQNQEGADQMSSFLNSSHLGLDLSSLLSPSIILIEQISDQRRLEPDF